ncbi:carboxylesterase/lipase family protein [Peribacillus psychrosaccharolyticus]|uniref:Carboxylic ester hydrolase n=1 Tax=Peribacillus psychrosaccharolyticus TaxID=1407 RepID=A0A974NNA8_PERPY|nr:carboxylesterase/lipase family protein [Peribacillus psychrosaccharolyticus]MEC2057247.1 carboxylesterase/lipase family protein [Peribacillus psychrosaccharolyticus]MED3742924.1 carboxylesterase/lipase family protein [Peribacillus psychrosaccharolyticus]QQT01010.1 carboxylesterase/lipase family protein [Peribacillus psychrosaccharolyticus]
MTGTLVKTTNGQINGKSVGNVFVWKGIPYAKPPIGKLRFMAPEKHDSWQGVREAVEFSSVAVQKRREIMKFLGDNPMDSSEDCLYLNIWSPSPDEKRRPVLVWIHGGAFTNGSGSSPAYNGESFAEMGDIVVVTVNYRLGIFGFLHLGELGGERYAASGNCGILDQIAALKWIHDNITAFGGDPNKITVAGESAGAMSVAALLAMPTAAGLFQQAILQSCPPNMYHTKQQATDTAKRVLKQLQLTENDLARLEDLSVDDLLEAAADVTTWCPTVDGEYFPQNPQQALSAGSSKNIPVMIGTNRDEHNLFTFFDQSWRTIDEKEIRSRFEKSLGSLWSQLSPSFKESPLTHQLYDQVMTFNLFTYPSIQLAEQQIKQGAPVWMYRFDYESPIFEGRMKAFHALELLFVWNNLHKSAPFLAGTPEEQLLADQIHQAWIAFIRTGNPDEQSMVHWPPYDLDKRTTLLFDRESRVEHDPDKGNRLLWDHAIEVIH